MAACVRVWLVNAHTDQKNNVSLETHKKLENCWLIEATPLSNTRTDKEVICHHRARDCHNVASRSCFVAQRQERESSSEVFGTEIHSATTLTTTLSLMLLPPM